MASDDFFLNDEEQTIIHKALVFYHEHPEYRDQPELADEAETLRSLITEFSPTPEII